MSSNTTNNPTSQTGSGQQAQYPQESVPAANVSNQESKVGQTDVNQSGADKAAERAYEERIEEEYAKREGGA